MNQKGENRHAREEAATRSRAAACLPAWLVMRLGASSLLDRVGGGDVGQCSKRQDVRDRRKVFGVPGLGSVCG